MDLFSSGFVDILAAEQTPESESWFQGTADAVRKARRHFGPHEADHYLILAGDHLYRMDYRRLLDAHIQQEADITIAALPASPEDATGRQLIPEALARCRVSAYLYNGYWADVGTIDGFYDANIQLTPPNAAFNFYDANSPIYTHPRFLPPSRFIGANVRNGLVAEGAYLERCEVVDSVVGIRTTVRSGAQVRQSVLLGADYFDDEGPASLVPLGIGRDVVLDRVIVDKNARIGNGARLVNRSSVSHQDGPGYFIRNGIVVVPKGLDDSGGIRAVEH